MSRNPEFNNKRLEFARRRRGITIKSISKAVGITAKAYSNYEKGIRVPPDDTLAVLAKRLKFPQKFFHLDDPILLDTSCVSFRSLSRITANVRNKALHAGQIALEFSLWIDKKFELPAPDLPDLRFCDPEAAAESLRNEWGIGERPIKNIVHLLESKGARVFSLEEDTQDLDAYSFWEDEVPFIFLNTRKSVERSRFDAAHELGHLVLHRQGSVSGKEVEAEANRFASAFLMSQGSVIARTSRFVTLDWIIVNKAYWLISSPALVRRLSDLKLISEWQYRTLMVEMSRRGYVRQEPNAIKQREFSKLLPMIFKALKHDKISKNDIANELGVYTADIDAIIFNLTFVKINGGGINSNKQKSFSHLKLVK